jgi:hypothetical protein
MPKLGGRSRNKSSYKSPCDHQWIYYPTRDGIIPRRCVKCNFIVYEKSNVEATCKHEHAHYLGVNNEYDLEYQCDSCKEKFVEKGGCRHLHRAVGSRQLPINLAGEQLYLYYERCLDCGKELGAEHPPQPVLQERCSGCSNEGTLMHHTMPTGCIITMCGLCGKYTMVETTKTIAQEQRVQQGVVNAQLDMMRLNMNPPEQRVQRGTINAMNPVVQTRRSDGPFWQANATYFQGERIYTFDGQQWQVSTGGITGPQEPNWNGLAVRDGTVVWRAAGIAVRVSINSSHTTTVEKKSIVTVAIDPKPRRFLWDT